MSTLYNIVLKDKIWKIRSNGENVPDKLAPEQAIQTQSDLVRELQRNVKWYPEGSIFRLHGRYAALVNQGKVLPILRNEAHQARPVFDWLGRVVYAEDASEESRKIIIHRIDSEEYTVECQNMPSSAAATMLTHAVRHLVKTAGVEFRSCECEYFVAQLFDGLRTTERKHEQKS